MSERRITEEELVEMEGYKGSLYARAAAAIRELREDLEKYGRHDEINCPQAGREHPKHLAAPCTCGLDDALK